MPPGMVTGSDVLCVFLPLLLWDAIDRWSQDVREARRRARANAMDSLPSDSADEVTPDPTL